MNKRYVKTCCGVLVVVLVDPGLLFHAWTRNLATGGQDSKLEVTHRPPRACWRAKVSQEQTSYAAAHVSSCFRKQPRALAAACTGNEHSTDVGKSVWAICQVTC